jgi:hypothetical protein
MSPSVELFGDVLHRHLDKGLVFIDSTRFVADPDKASYGSAHRSSRASGVLLVSDGTLV